MAKRVGEAVERQLADLPRADTARQAIAASRLIVRARLDQCIAISNQYGPEHLIIQTRNARDLVDSITSAGSVFLGDGHRSPRAITPPAPTTCCPRKATPLPVRAWAWRISRNA